MPTREVVVSQTEALQRGLASAGEQLGSTLRGTFDEFLKRGLTDRKDIAAWIDATLPAVRAAGVEGAALSQGYSSVITAQRVGAVTASDYAMLVPLEDPYLRLWRGLADGLSFSEAAESSFAVTEQLGVDAVQQASRHAMRLSGNPRSQWRRVLTGAENCRWCATVSTQLYHSAESATFGHKTCDCTVVEVANDSTSNAIDALMEDRYRALKVAGTIDWASQDRTRRRVQDSGSTASERRDDLLAQAVVESDSEVRRSLLDQAVEADKTARAAHAKAAELAAGI